MYLSPGPFFDAAVHQEQDHVYFFEGIQRHIRHGCPQLVSCLVNARRIDEHHLHAVSFPFLVKPGIDASDAVSRRLGLVRRNGDLFS